MFGPKKISLQDIGLQSFGALIAGFIGSLVLLVCVFALSGVLDISGNISSGTNRVEYNPLFPFALSLLTFFGSSITVFLLSYILSLLDTERYKQNTLVSTQLALYGILIYIGITPVYIFVGMQNYEYLMFLFMIHSLLLGFGSLLLLEIIQNIRSIILSFYASIIALCTTSVICLSIFMQFESGFAKLLSLLFLLPLIFGLLVFVKIALEYLYYRYYLWSGYDPLGDIYTQIERKEREEIQEIAQKNIL